MSRLYDHSNLLNFEADLKYPTSCLGGGGARFTNKFKTFFFFKECSAVKLANWNSANWNPHLCNTFAPFLFLAKKGGVRDSGGNQLRFEMLCFPGHLQWLM